MEYTKGKWKILEANNGTFFLRDSAGVEICEYIRGRGNAHLIASAPELYEALRGLFDAIGTYIGFPVEVMESARQAIAKADGK